MEKVTNITGFEQGTFSSYGDSGPVTDVANDTRIRTSGYIQGNPLKSVKISATSSTGKALQVALLGYKENTNTSLIFNKNWYNVPYDFDLSAYAELKFFRILLKYTDGTKITPDELSECTLTEFFDWYISNGEIVFENMLTAPEKDMAKPYPKALWRMDRNLSPNLPYHELFPLLKAVHVKPVAQYDYITIYDMRTEQDNFDNNGLAVLDPISCTVTETFNAGWTVTLEHPVDTDEKWKYIVEFNILKVLGQLFVIKKIEHSWTGNSGKVTAYAEHVFYQLNDSWIKKGSNINGPNGKRIIFEALSNARFELREGDTYYRFNSNSDLTSENTDVDMGTVTMNKWLPTQNAMTPLEFLLGSDGFTANFGGDLYRDNFYFSINKVMENGRFDSFDIRVGINLKGITRTVDTSSLCTHFTAYDKFGSSFSYFWETHGSIPHHIVRSQEFSFGENYTKTDFKVLGHEAGKYFGQHWKPLISYTISLEDTRNNPDYIEFSNHPRYNVGDRGRIFDERLNISIDAFVSGTVKDGITGKTLEIKFSNQNEFLRNNNYDISFEESAPSPPNIPDENPDENNEDKEVTE